MIFNIITLFPDFFKSPVETGLLGKAVEKNIIKINTVNLRDFSTDKHRKCDDYPYGGGPGMVLLPEPLMAAAASLKKPGAKVILTSAGGRILDQKLARDLSGEKEICIVCGNYEGVDQRVIDHCVDLEVSVGDFVLSGGEFAALVIIDAVARYIPGFMSNSESLSEESFEAGLLEYPHYTRPAELCGMTVPEVLLNGDHRAIADWRFEMSLAKTSKGRPDLYKTYIKKKLTGVEP